MQPYNTPFATSKISNYVRLFYQNLLVKIELEDTVNNKIKPKIFNSGKITLFLN